MIRHRTGLFLLLTIIINATSSQACNINLDKLCEEYSHKINQDLVSLPNHAKQDVAALVHEVTQKICAVNLLKFNYYIGDFLLRKEIDAYLKQRYAELRQEFNEYKLAMSLGILDGAAYSSEHPSSDNSKSLGSIASDHSLDSLDSSLSSLTMQEQPLNHTAITRFPSNNNTTISPQIITRIPLSPIETDNTMRASTSPSPHILIQDFLAHIKKLHAYLFLFPAQLDQLLMAASDAKPEALPQLNQLLARYLQANFSAIAVEIIGTGKNDSAYTQLGKRFDRVQAALEGLYLYSKHNKIASCYYAAITKNMHFFNVDEFDYVCNTFYHSVDSSEFNDVFNIGKHVAHRNIIAAQTIMAPANFLLQHSTITTMDSSSLKKIIQTLYDYNFLTLSQVTHLKKKIDWFTDKERLERLLPYVVANAFILASINLTTPGKTIASKNLAIISEYYFTSSNQVFSPRFVSWFKEALQELISNTVNATMIPQALQSLESSLFNELLQNNHANT